MAIQPVLRDDNGIALADRGSEVITVRYVGIDTSGASIDLPVDVKDVVIHLEGSVVRAKLLGTASGSREIYWTSDGITLPHLSVVKESGSTLLTLAAGSGTVNVSVMAWR